MIAYLAAEGFLKELLRELGAEPKAVHGDLVLLEKPAAAHAWAQNIWQAPEYIRFSSISEAANALRKLGKLWAYYPIAHHRRAALIQEKLPYFQPKPIPFLGKIPAGPLGGWTLIEPDLILASPTCSSPFAHGRMEFQEDKITPPSRAYLKLWELITVHGIRPKAGEHCLDLGSCPGGWTWVLQTLGAEVTSVDKAPLDERIGSLPNIHYLKKDAFTLRPEEVKNVDWFFSDIICYPEKLFELVMRWKESGKVKNFVCTIKFQGATDFAALEKFASVPGSRLLHLAHNKHELTWVLYEA